MRAYRFLCGFGVAIVILISAPLAGAVTFPGQNGSVAYSAMRGKSTDVRTVHADGGYNRLIAKNAQNPTWSPNGRKLAYILQGKLYTTSVNGEKKRLTHSLGSIEHSPAWSADGKYIAFVRTIKTSNAQSQSAIFTIKPSGANERNVTGWLKNGTYNSPSFSPDGTRLVYEKAAENGRELSIKNLTINYERLLTTLSDNVDSNVSWSPNGKKILYNDSGNEVYTIWPDGSHRTIISDGDSYQASWSPDGNRIVFLEDPSDEIISISEPDGSISYVPIDKMGYDAIGAPLFSPDGKKLIFTLTSEQTSALFSLELGKEGVQPLKLASGVIADMSWQTAK